jgi:tight adherence protein B
VPSVRSLPRRLLVVLLAFAAVLGGTFTAGTASADTRSPVLAFREIDASQSGVISANLSWSGTPEAISSAQVLVNGTSVDAQISPRGTNVQQAIVFVVDTSAAAADSGVLNSTKTWIKNWVQGLSGPQRQNQPIAIYAAGANPVLVQDFTTDGEKLVASVDRLNAKSGSTSQDPANERSNLWAATKDAADRLSTYQIDQRNIITISAAGNTSATDSSAVASGAVKAAGSAYFAVVGPQATVSGKMEELSTATGGFSASVLETSAVAGSLNQVADIVTKGQYQILINEDVSDGTVTVSVSVGGSQTSGTVLNGAAVSGTTNLTTPVTVAEGGGLFSNKVVLIVALILVALAIGFIVYTVANNLFNTYSFSDQIASYNRFRETFDSGEGVEEAEQSRFGATKNFIVQKAVETAERIAEERGILSRVESALERANLAIKPAEFIVLYVAIVIALPLVGLYLGGLLIMLAFGFVAAFAPIALLSNMAERRRSKFLAQLPDTLHLLAGSLRAGYSLMQGVEAVSEETPEPIAQELRRVITETRLGGDLIESLDKVALRMNSQDFGWVVMGISIQSEVGGDLAELLDTVSETMVERQRLRREIKALTAEGRISALVLICLPIALLIILNFMNPEYGSALFTSTLGQILLLLGGLSLILGWLWMKKIVAIKV